MTHCMGGLISSTVKKVEICSDSESIYRIFDVALVELKVYESKIWPTIPEFEPKGVIQRICGLPNAHGMGKLLTHSLTIINRVLPHMLCFTFLPQGRHWDKVSYYEVFLIDSILTMRQIHLGYLIMMHIIACCESMTRVFPYGRFLSRVFKDSNINLSRKTDFEAPSIYDTYDDEFMG